MASPFVLFAPIQCAPHPLAPNALPLPSLQILLPFSRPAARASLMSFFPVLQPDYAQLSACNFAQIGVVMVRVRGGPLGCPQWLETQERRAAPATPACRSTASMHGHAEPDVYAVCLKFFINRLGSSRLLVVRPEPCAMASGPATAAALAGPLAQHRHRGHAIAAAPPARRAAGGATAAAATRLPSPQHHDLLRRSSSNQLPCRSSSSQLPRRSRLAQPTTSALGAFSSGRAERRPPRRRLIPPALMARLSMTLLLVWLARLGHYIPLPGGYATETCAYRRRCMHAAAATAVERGGFCSSHAR